MINIIVDTIDEYNKIKGYAEDYVCRQISCTECYGVDCCDKCYEDNHVKHGIQIISIDNISTEKI